MKIHFSEEKRKYRLKNRKKIREWIQKVILLENKALGNLSFLFCSDESLYQKNLAFLSHKTYTDIITFDYSQGNIIYGEIFISVDRVKENALNFSVPEEEELKRVIVHGVLHLCGHKDKTKEQKAKMRKRENKHLRHFNE